MNLFVILVLFSFSIGNLNAQTEDDLKNFNQEKFTLVQRLLTCQSLAYTTMNEKDYQTRYIYMNLGSTNYNYAYKSFINLQGYNIEMDKKLIENISTVLKLYAKSFESVDSLNKPELALGLSFSDAYLMYIIKALYEK